MRKRIAFTLIELLVVIAIITALLAILMPSIGHALYASNLAVCSSNLRQIHYVSTEYASDHFRMYPQDNLPGLRPRSTAPYPAVLAPYFGGSVDSRTNALLRCPQIDSEGDSLGSTKHNVRHYQTYFNFHNALRSGSVNAGGDRAYANDINEAMPRMGSTRISRGSPFLGGGTWESDIVASDIAQQWSIYVQGGHMRGGSRYTGGYGPLRQWTTDAVVTANYSFQDGHVERFSFVRTDIEDTMMVAADYGASWDNFILPKSVIRSYP